MKQVYLISHFSTSPIFIFNVEAKNPAAPRFIICAAKVQYNIELTKKIHGKNAKKA
jgi:hypothetical protein